ncbi:MAG TPA: serine protease [Dongiaceae bacterium]|nr:serine protease [Dongiaceae bacterium]
MANSDKPEAASLAATDMARPWPRLRPLVLALACALLGACAARPPEAPAPATAPTGWQAAIGSLDVTGSPEVCTAVLVRQDMIATTSHCLRPKGRFAQPSQLVFTPSAAGPRVRGSALVAEGGSVAPGSIKPDQAETDWALVRITPPLSGIRPLPLASLSPAMVRAEVAKGARFYSAGYGQGAKDELRSHERCGLLPPDPNGVTEGALFFATDCIIRLGDSGGPVILIQGGQPKLIGLIVGFASAPKTGDPIGIVVSAKAFAGYLGADLVSQLFPVALPPEISMN